MKKTMEKLTNFAMGYGIIGILLGAFYREYTKFIGFIGETRMSIVHTHTLVLGMFFTLIVLLLEKNFKLSKDEKYDRFFRLYNLSVIAIIILFMIKGFLDISGYDMLGAVLGSFNGISGIFHIIFTYSAIVFFNILRRRISLE